MKNTLKVLILYPNGSMMNPPPISIGIFTALLKENGFDIELFDTTFYSDPDGMGSDEAKEKFLMVRPADDSERSAAVLKRRMEDDLVKKVEEYRPDLITISLLELTYPVALSMLEAIEHYLKENEVTVLAGGVFAYSAPEIVLSNKNISAVCIGEGEGTLIDVCKRLSAGENYHDVQNLAFKRDGRIVRNPLRPLEDISAQPIPDYSLFKPERFLRPMGGKVYRSIPIETNRGCPYLCSYCNSPATLDMYKDRSDGGFFRKKSGVAIQRELRYLIDKWDAEYVYFSSDTFILFSDKEFEEFVEMYSEFKLPFWIQSRAETITEYRIKKLKEIGCHRMSLGLEHGNEKFRKEVIKKPFDNETMIRASKLIADAGIPLSVNNIIGFPEETRELIFDTIELNRNITFDTTNAFPYAPFHGTHLHKVCLEKGYITNEFNPGSLNVDAPLDMPQLSREEIGGLRKTFALYARMPKKYWPKIKIAEKADKEGKKAYSELRQIYQDEFFGTPKDDDGNELPADDIARTSAVFD